MTDQEGKNVTEENMLKVLRRVMFELDPAVGGPVKPGIRPVFYSGMQVLEVEMGDDSTTVLTVATRAEGTFDPETDPLGPEVWYRWVDGFAEVVALNERKETKLGALLSVLREDGPMVIPGPDPATLRPVPMRKN